MIDTVLNMIIGNSLLGEVIPINDPDFSIFTLWEDFGTDHIHPMFVHFPIALGMFGVLVYALTYFFKRDSKSWIFFSFFILLFASISSICAVITGSLFTFHLHQDLDPHIAQNWHSTMATTSMILFCLGSFIQIVAYWWKHDLFYYKSLCLAIYLAAGLCIMITGFIGGSIVYDFLINPVLTEGS